MITTVEGVPLIIRCLNRAKLIKDVSNIILATTTSPEDKQLIDTAERMGVIGFAGDEQDVLDRYYQASKLYEADVIMRLTGDCPLLDPEVCHEVLTAYNNNYFDYVDNCHPPTYPDGLDTEVFSFAALETAWREATAPSDREHVTQYIWRHPNKFTLGHVVAKNNLSHHRWTVDEEPDLEYVRKVFQGLGERNLRGYKLSEVLRVIEEDKLYDASCGINRNIGQVSSMETDGLNYYKAMKNLNHTEIKAGSFHALNN